MRSCASSSRRRRTAPPRRPSPDFLIAKHIEVNKEALSDDLKEITEQIDDLRAALANKKSEKMALEAAALDEADLASDPAFAGMSAQERAEAIEASRRDGALARIKAVAENEQEQRSYDSELAQLLEIQKKLMARLEQADATKAVEEERIRSEVEESAAEKRREVEEKAMAMEAALRAAEQACLRVRLRLRRW